MSEACDPTPRTVFNESWWLDAAAERRWEFVETRPHGGYRARLPICWTTSLWRPIVKLPPLTHSLDPIFEQVDKRAVLSVRCRTALLDELIAQLPRVPIATTLSPNATDLHILPRHGFAVEAAFTFRIPSSTDVDTLWRGMRDYTRNNVRRASEKFQVVRSFDAEAFVSFYERNVHRTGQAMKPRRELIAGVIGAAIARGRGQALLCQDASGTPVSGVFVVWDEAWCYFLLSTRDKERAGKGAGTFLIWEALKDACDRGLGFDFAGPNPFGNQFGAKPAGYHMASRLHPVERAAKLIHGWVFSSRARSGQEGAHSV